MEGLPEDILIEIFNLFCAHCQQPSQFPHADTTEVCDNKRTLAYLCRVCRNFFPIARPILYHYYATGNLEKREKRNGPLEVHMTHDFLPQFLRTITQDPELAAHIVTMQFVNSSVTVGYEAQIDTIRALTQFSTTNNLVAVPPTKWLDNSISTPCEERCFNIHEWMITLAMVLAPRLQSVLIALGPNPEFNYLHNSENLRLPSLKTLGLISYSGDYHITHLAHLYAAAPNLTTLYASDASGWLGNPMSWHRGSSKCNIKYELHLSQLHRLAISGLLSENLGSLLPCMPHLEDLEYYWDVHEFTSFNLGELLQPVKKTLKRLCVSFLPGWEYADEGPGALDMDYPVISTLSDFPCLEDLTIDCRSLYHAEDVDEPDRLIEILPKTIHRLRISYIYREIDVGLLQLASQAPQDFPNLKDIILGFCGRLDVVDDDDKERFRRMRAMGSLFTTAGINFNVRTDLYTADIRTMIPGAMAGSIVRPLPSLMDKSEDPEKKYGCSF
ncbi:hypothetical protein BDV95DRAFT_668887 [Massariosphaeria phaeospora]|uniref:F-box domain-containing protein n=1 Tax=Massariosphaeria phaeospora TaxID=100035 RepID=A0A7C8I4N9_9PLEO|nr:hypothetical protein BDV95DRAFT_668887 [Massariosphaeria phaeospora]